MYEAQTKAAILQRMLDASPSDIDKRAGSPTYDLLSPAAIELMLAYAELDNVLNFGFAGTSYGPYLDLRASEYGLTRKAATKAEGFVTFSGPNSTLVPAGTQVSTGTAAPIYFVTIADGTIAGGTVDIAAEAVQAGSSGNVAASAVNTVTGDLVGVITVINAAEFEGGTDTESDADLLARYYERAQRPATSGNANQYRQWALSVSGVGDARVFPLWAGAGTVKVTVIDQAREPAGSGLIADVADYIETVRPIGADVTVDTAAALPITVAATITLASGYSLGAVEVAYETAVIAYLREIAFKQSFVSYARIGTLLLNTPGVVDYTGLTLNGGAVNIAVDNDEVATFSGVSLGV
ncbi:baseplate J/gp47 family protein [Mycobacterium gordonae]|nr:baseplate J/gp47 family protein [Mycobacterium gordonae]